MNRLAIAVIVLASSASAQQIQRVSVGAGGVQADARSVRASVSWDHRYIAFESNASNLVAGDTNDRHDVFVRDLGTGTTELVSIGTDGQHGNGESSSPRISGRGRYVAFISWASNFVPGDTLANWDVFLHDRRTHLTQCVSLNLAGVTGLGGYDGGTSLSVSIDGRFVAFDSDAQDLVTGPQDGHVQVYVRDMLTGTTECISVDPSGAQGTYHSGHTSMSANGRYVAFSGFAANLVPGDTQNTLDVFVRDRWNHTTIRASSNGDFMLPSISYDGRFIASQGVVAGHANWSIFLHDLLLGTTTWVSHGPGGEDPNQMCLLPFISPSGRYVAYQSTASNILPGDSPYTSDVFRWDRLSDQTKLVSASSGGTLGNGDSGQSSVSMLGRVAFVSDANNLVLGDTNGVGDVFIKAP